MDGVQFVMDDKGRKVGVLIDLRKHGELWEDMYDALLIQEREGEPRESLQAVERRLRRAGKLRAS